MENLLKFPALCFVDKLIPKAKFVKASDTPTAVRDLLTEEFEQIRLIYVLRVDTLNIEPGTEVSEIDVFYLKLKVKSGNLNLKFNDDSNFITQLSKLDQLIPRHTIFLIQYGDSFDLLMQHKQRTPSRERVTWKIVSSELRRQVNLSELNLLIEGNNLDNVYINFLAQMSQKQIENFADYIEQKREDEHISKIMRQIATLEKQMKATNQPRRKREINVQIKKLTQDL